MIDMYMKCSQEEMACIIFDNMPNKTAVSWNSLISGFIRSGDVKSAWKVFNEMPKS
ncbi:putative pentatricopeptide [Rosa chinensis]|uniref:Putative pentatricopeptide n=1 Tax=Rosa chinensis TaxID=74649 RepID=A0A2P6QPA6_ROSCH|nr:putative pentatricopeptide [Rosa chinensis]